MRAAPHDRRPLVQERRDLLPFRRHLYGRQWRRHRRFQGPVAAAGLSAWARHHRDLADAVPAVARQGRRLRHLRLLWRRSALRHAGRLRRIHPWLPAARHPRDHRPRRQSHLRPACVVSRTREAQRIRPHRDWYVWSDKRPANANTGMVFPGVQKSTWTRDKEAGAWYFHRFYDFQPDLNTSNPHVQAEILKIMGFWIQLGVSGFRMDAVPFIIATKGAEGPQAGRAIRHAAFVPRIPAMAKGRRHHPRRSQRAAGNRHGIFRP